MADNSDRWLYEIEKRKIVQESMVTDHKKNRYIKEIVSGLGEEIKKEPNKAPKKLTLIEKLMKMLF
jgi:hypothetical protein